MFMRASQKRRTTIQPEGKEATWNESFKLPVHIPETQKLELILYDHDNIGSDDELGRCAALIWFRFTPSCIRRLLSAMQLCFILSAGSHLPASCYTIGPCMLYSLLRPLIFPGTMFWAGWSMTA